LQSIVQKLKENKIGFILEGSDQSGKSTICNKLSSLFSYPVFHYKYPSTYSDMYLEYSYKLEEKIPYIFDRNFISEMVYGELFRNSIKIYEYLPDLIDRYKQEKYILILCHPFSFNFINREEVFNKDQIFCARQKYISLFSQIPLPKILINPFLSGSLQYVLNKSLYLSNLFYRGN